MAPSKKNKTAQDQALAAKRVEFVKSKPELAPVEARTRFFVQTRAAELQAKGVEVTKQKRQELRQKFATGGVQRQGFYTPGDLQRIAAAKAGNSGSKDVSTSISTGTNTSSVYSGANLADVKTSGDQAVRMGRKAAQPKNTLGISNRFENAIKNPAADFFGSPVGKFVKGAYNLAESTAESFNATFINPVVNLGGAAIGKNPNLRVAGPLEAAINTADVALTIATLGTSKGVTAVPVAAAKRSILKTTASKAANAIDDIMPGMNVSGKLSSVGKNSARFVDETKTAALTKIEPKLKAATPVKSSTPKAGVKTARSADGVPAFLKTADDMPATPKPTRAKASAKPKATLKPRASSAPKNAAGEPYKSMRDIDIDMKFGSPAEQNAARRASGADQVADAMNQMGSPNVIDLGPKATAKPKAAAKPKATTKPKAAKKEVDRFADAWDDSPIDMNKVDFSEFGMESSKPYSTARRATTKKADDVAPAPVSKPAAKKTPAKKSTPKTTAPKANAKAAFDKSVAPVKAGSQTKLTFKTQADYNQFLKTGGRERLRQMSPDVLKSFMKVNAKWAEGAKAAREAAATAQKNTAARAIARKGRYDRARPALKAKFNEALIKKQERELLAKVTKKK